ncbi:RNA polymerase sigma factor [Sedimentibacter sp.]|uniref:RNA polymerase sigma factor n=1 Tax=Sedimentibacter sp. TaxID=1960295 RepID=UPI0028A25DC9|nr:RNA polymerase sigma factor [Sedimentibacter sp.]
MEEMAIDNDINDIREIELNEAIELYGHKLLRYCHNILCDYADAQDAVQETFIKAYCKRNLFKKNTSMQAWLYRIAYTTCIDMLRYKKLRSFIPYSVQASDVCESKEYMSEELKAALMTLSPKDRALVFSRVIDEKSYSELELIYNASATALRKRYERAKKKLAGILRENGTDYSEREERDE